jgi:hypothetical protein
LVLLGAAVVIIVVILVAVIVVVTKNNKYPDYSKLTYKIADTCTYNLCRLDPGSSY